VDLTGEVIENVKGATLRFWPLIEAFVEFEISLRSLTDTLGPYWP
jgi:hypothetical protein